MEFLCHLMASFRVAVGAAEGLVEQNCSSHLNTVDLLDIRDILVGHCLACHTCWDNHQGEARMLDGVHIVHSMVVQHKGPLAGQVEVGVDPVVEAHFLLHLELTF